MAACRQACTSSVQASWAYTHALRTLAKQWFIIYFRYVKMAGTDEKLTLFVGQTFSTYCENSIQIFCVSYSKSVEQYNKLRSKKLNPQLKYSCIQYTCKCGGKERHKSNPNPKQRNRYPTSAEVKQACSFKSPRSAQYSFVPAYECCNSLDSACIYSYI
jgi:hypothetical protein